MSYVLEALKRANAERERESHGVPGLQAQAVALLAQPRVRNGLWPVAAAAAVALVAAALLWWQMRAAPSPVVLPTAPASPTPAQQAPPPAVAVPVSQAPVPAAPTIKPAPARVPRMSELPPDLRNALPKLVVNGSVYANQAADRLLILNGQPLHEGDQVAPDLVLEQIQAQAAVLSLRGTRFFLPF